MRVSRAEPSLLSDWWFSVDRLMLVTVLVLMLAGMVFMFAAGPAAAHRLGLGEFHFVIRHALFLIPSVLLLFAVSLLDPAQIRRLGLALFIAGLVFILAGFLQGVEKNGATRWVVFAGLSLQPSEIAKPGFVVLSAFLFAEARRRPDMPALPLAIGALALLAALLVSQPDIGQTVLIACVWGGLFFAAGYPLRWMALLALLAAAGLAVAYLLVPHVGDRIDLFFDPAASGNRQSAVALSAFAHGGWFGRGPGEGTVKMQLPDSHNDYVLAVIAEELGVAACLLLIALYGIIVLRGFAAALRQSDDFSRLALSGLVLLLGLQTLINMAVNVHLLPAKGMTLPFISYGGSSLLSASLTIGMILALSRRRPRAGALAGMGAPVHFGLVAGCDVPAGGIRR